MRLDEIFAESASPLTYAGTREWRRLMKTAKPGTPEWFRVWFTRPYLTNGPRETSDKR